MKSEDHKTAYNINTLSREKMISWIVFFIYHIIYWLSYLAIFYNSCIKNYSISLRESWLVLLFLMLISALLSHKCRSLCIGEENISELLTSQAASIILSYISIVILYSTFKFPAINFASWVQSIFITLIISFIWTIIGDKLFFKIHSVPNTILVYGTSGIESFIEFIRPNPKKFQITASISLDDVSSDLSLLTEYDAVILYQIPLTQRNNILQYCVEFGLECYLYPEINDLLLSNSTYSNMLKVPLLSLQSNDAKIAYRLAKRFFDVLLSSIALIILSPLMLLIALLIKLEDGGPVFFKQVRLTKGFKKFYMYKFRSMHVDADVDGIPRLAKENDSRITKIGEFIRKTKIDELPQLINIIKGDMSIVGPRPEALEIAYQDAEGLPEFHLRLLVKGGLTGYAQVYGDYDSKPHDKLQMDLFYIANRSLLLDWKLILATLPAIVFHKKNIKANNYKSIVPLQEINNSEVE